MVAARKIRSLKPTEPNGTNGTNGTNGDSDGSHDQSDKDDDKKDDKDGGNPFAKKDKDPEEAQYKGPSKKYHTPGYEKSKLAAEGREFAENISDLDSILDALTESDQPAQELVEEKNCPCCDGPCKCSPSCKNCSCKKDEGPQTECESFENRLGDALTIQEGQCTCSGDKCKCPPGCAKCGCGKKPMADG